MKLSNLISAVDPRLAFFYVRRRYYSRLKQREERGFISQWFLLCGQAPKEFLLKPDPAKLRKIFPPPDRLWADPFLYRSGSGYHLFIEEWLFGEPRGHISTMRLSPEGEPLSEPQPIIQEPYHLSYPFLVEHDGKLLMLPEGGAGGAINVYECSNLPLEWHRKTVLMQGVHYADPTLFCHDGKWWLFATLKYGLHGLTRDLFLFWADHPLSSNWQPHPQNPIVRSERSARPAGPLFEVNGRIFRPAQNCLIRYGNKLKISEVVELNTRHYRERPAYEVEPTFERGVRATHHIHWCEGLIVMDAQRLLPESEVIRRKTS